MSRKRFAYSGQAGGPAKARDALAKAYLRVFSGEDGEMVLAIWRRQRLTVAVYGSG